MAVPSSLKLIVFTLLIHLGSFYQGKSQFAFSSYYFSENVNQANRLGEKEIFPSKVGVIMAGFNYWFRLKNFRTEFYPGIQYSHSLFPSEYKIKENGILIETPVHFYPFDFKNDCNCPTFGKEGSLFNKGFFLKLTTMHKWNNRKFEQADSIKSSNYLFYFGLGAGLEIPIGKLWSVLPSISYLSNTNDFIESSKKHEFNRQGIQFGISTLYRYDYRKNYRRR